MDKDYCSKCRIQTNHEVLYSVMTGSSRNESFDWSRQFQTIKCKGCDNIQFRIVYKDESMIAWDSGTEEEFYYDQKTYYPPNIDGHNGFKNKFAIPEKIRIVYFETLEAIKNKCYMLSAVGLRAVIEAICLEQKIKGGNLVQKIKNLTKNKLITEKDEHRLHSIRFLGNDSVHEMEVPQKMQILIALEITESLINTLYLIDIQVKKHLESIITDYSEFKNLLLKKVGVLSVGEEKSIKEILKKEFRRIENSFIPNFMQDLIDEINNGTLHLISIGKLSSSSIEKVPVQHFIKN